MNRPFDRFPILAGVLAAGFVLVFASVLPVSAEEGEGEPASAATNPGADEILRFVRFSYTVYDRDFKGHIRKGFKQAPFTLALRPGSMSFAFRKPDQVVRLSVSGPEPVLEELLRGNPIPVPAATYGQTIRETDVTYEDLSMHFLYWKDATVLDRPRIKGRDTWLVRVRHKNPPGAYAAVDIYVDQEAGGFLKLIGYADAEATEVLKEFEVLGGKRMGDIWMVDKMRVKTVDPKTGKSKGVSYLEILEALPEAE